MTPKYPSSMANQIVENITNSLESIGVMFRIFQRVKTLASLDRKINSKNKYLNFESKIQDLVGIRIVLYFADDIKIVHNLISSLYKESRSDQSIDDLDAKTFNPVRYNLIYHLQEDECYSLQSNYTDYVDSTFELQIRTVLSEGWHEVEHDLRYKFEDDWLNSLPESRRMNGVYASLETSEWTMIQILEAVAYRQYKERNWEAMFRQKLRLRIHDFSLGEELCNIFNTDTESAKSFFRIDRDKLIYQLYKQEYSYPLNLKNLVYFANVVFIKNEKILNLTPSEFVEEFTNEDEQE